MAYKAKSITSKASSACKMNMGLVYGAADVAGSKKFVDQGEGMAEKFSGGGGGSAPQSKPDSDDKNDDKTEDKKGGQADAAVSTDSTEQ
jgi:hypothetical protein